MTGSPHPDLAALSLEAQYPSAVIDRLARRVDRLPIPAWLFYLALFGAGYLLFAVGRWLSGQRDPSVLLLPAPAVIWNVSILALHQYLDRYGIRALHTFNRTLNASDDQLRQLETRLTVIPLRVEAVGSLVWLAIAASLARVQLSKFSEFFAGWELVVSVVSFVIGGAFFAHVIHQLRLVSKIHASAREIDLFDPEPLYSFSGLTVRTALGIVLAQYLVLLALPGEIRTSTVLIPTAAVVALAVVVFVWPLWGMHQRLVASKEQIQGDINSLLRRSVAEVTQGVESGVVEDPERLEKTLSALRAAQATVDDLPTWPWQPSTVRGFVTALLLPVVVFLLQAIAARLAGL